MLAFGSISFLYIKFVWYTLNVTGKKWLVEFWDLTSLNQFNCHVGQFLFRIYFLAFWLLLWIANWLYPGGRKFFFILLQWVKSFCLQFLSLLLIWILSRRKFFLSRGDCTIILHHYFSIKSINQYEKKYGSRTQFNSFLKTLFFYLLNHKVG